MWLKMRFIGITYSLYPYFRVSVIMSMPIDCRVVLPSVNLVSYTSTTSAEIRNFLDYCAGGIKDIRLIFVLFNILTKNKM